MLQIGVDTNFLLDSFGFRRKGVLPETRALVEDLKWLVGNGLAQVSVSTQVWLEFVDRIRTRHLAEQVTKTTSGAIEQSVQREPKHFLALMRDPNLSSLIEQEVRMFFDNNRTWLKCVDHSFSVQAAKLAKDLVLHTHLTRKDALVFASLVDLEADIFVTGDTDFTNPDGIKLLRPVLKKHGLDGLEVLSQLRYSVPTAKTRCSADGHERDEGKSVPRNIRHWKLSHPEARRMLFRRASDGTPFEGNTVGTLDRFRIGRASARLMQVWYHHSSSREVAIGMKLFIVGSVFATGLRVAEIHLGKEPQSAWKCETGQPVGLSVLAEIDHESRLDPVIASVLRDDWTGHGCDYCELVTRGGAAVCLH